MLETPANVSQGEIKLDVRQVEPLLQALSMDMQRWPGAAIPFKDGRMMYSRETALDEAPEMLRHMKRVMDQDHDFYDIVGARERAEIASSYHSRLKDPYMLVGLVDGECVGFGNGNGWHRWAVGMAQPYYPWPGYQHELACARIYYGTQKYWDSVVKGCVREMSGAELRFDVPQQIVEVNSKLRLPAEVTL